MERGREEIERERGMWRQSERKRRERDVETEGEEEIEDTYR